MDKPILVNREAEAAVIGACLSDPNTIVFVAAETAPDDFTVPVYRWLAESIWWCFDNRIPPTMAAVIDRLTTNKRWSDRIGKAAVSMQDIDAVLGTIGESDIEFAPQNAKLVRLAAFRRTGHTELEKAAKLFDDTTRPVEDIQRDVLRQVCGVFEQRGNRDASITSIGGLERERVKSMKDDELPGISCGIRWLDELTGGFLPSETVVIGGAYKMRKTTLMLNMFLRSAHFAPLSVFTVGDSTRDDTYRKLVALQMNQMMIDEQWNDLGIVASSKTLQYKLTRPEYQDLRDRAEVAIDGLPIRLYDGRDMISDLNETSRYLRRDVALFGTRIFAYDFAQSNRHGKDDYEKTLFMSAWAQQICGELGITGVILSQLNEATIKSGTESYSPGAKGGGALAAMSNVFLITTYAAPMLKIELKLARAAQMGDKVVHQLNPPSGLILDAGRKENA
jgi:replicative DNA helicase